jgi:hypothetical protein
MKNKVTAVLKSIELQTLDMSVFMVLTEISHSAVNIVSVFRECVIQYRIYHSPVNQTTTETTDRTTAQTHKLNSLAMS